MLLMLPPDACRTSHAVARARSLPPSSAGLVALLLLSLAALPAGAQISIGMPSPSGQAGSMPPTVEGFVSAVNGSVVTLLGSELLRVDLSQATILAADATGGTPPPITPGAYLLATVEAPDVAILVYPPPPLVAKTAAVRPAGTAVLSGEIQGVGTDGFSLLFRMIQVDESTAFSGWGGSGPVEDLSDLKAGMHATAWVVTGSSGGLRATKVVAVAKPVLPKPLVFKGVVKSIDPSRWQIDDKTVFVTSETKIVGDPKVGDTVDVLATIEDPPNPMMGMPSRIVALLIVKVDAVTPPTPGRTFTFDGTVQSMPPTGTTGVWRIGDRIVMVTGLTKITGTPRVGSLVTVTGYAVPSPLAAGASPSASSVPIVATSIVVKP